MDQGVIWSLKSKYRILSVRRIITALENDEDMPSFSVLDAMKMLVLAWESVTEETIINCFSKAGISKDQQVAAINDDDDPFKALTKEIESLWGRKLDLAPEFASNNLLNVDEYLVCTESLLTDDDIIGQFTRSSNIFHLKSQKRLTRTSRNSNFFQFPLAVRVKRRQLFIYWPIHFNINFSKAISVELALWWW